MKFFQEQQSQSAIAIAAERSQWQILEKQAQETITKETNIIKLIEDSKLEIVEKLTEGLIMRFTEMQSVIEDKTKSMQQAAEVSGDKSRDLCVEAPAGQQVIQVN
jgi:hypothetical protein